jgi:hypothetical protein
MCSSGFLLTRLPHLYSTVLLLFWMGNPQLHGTNPFVSSILISHHHFFSIESTIMQTMEDLDATRAEAAAANQIPTVEDAAQAKQMLTQS